MSKYRLYRPFSIKRRIKSCLNPWNILTTLIVWSCFIIIDILKIAVKIIIYDIKYVYNFIYFRKIDYSYRQIIRMIRELSPREFEVFVAELYKCLGYTVEITAETCDGGKDVILYDDDGNVTYVECKHYSESNFVGREICQKLLGAVAIDGADNGIIICTGMFNKNAWEVYRKVDNLELIDMNGIMSIIKQIEVHQLPRIFMRTLQLSV